MQKEYNHNCVLDADICLELSSCFFKIILQTTVFICIGNSQVKYGSLFVLCILVILSVVVFCFLLSCSVA